jgi:signal transduction histidine kinase
MNGFLAARRGWGIALFGLSLALGVSPSPAPAAQPGSVPWNVLILYDAPLENPASATATAALRSALSASAAPRLVNVQSEVLDAVTFDATYYEGELLALLRKKNYARRLDLVMPMGGAGLAFARRHRGELWPGVPIVYFGTPAAGLREGRIGPNTTGVRYDVDEVGTLRLARRLQPNARRLVLVAGASEYDRSAGARLEGAAASAGDGLEVEKIFGQPIDAVLHRVSHLPSGSIVLYATISRDADGQAFTPADVAEELSRASVAPVYGVWESQLGRGIVGGSMESIAAHGRRAAEVALRVLRGASPDDIAVVPPAHPVPMVDWRQLQRFGLSETALPPGSVVLNRPPSFVKEHRAAVAVVALVLAVQSGLIVALLVQGRRRKRAEAEAALQRAELAHAARLSSVGELTASVAHEINQPLGAILSNAEAAELLLESAAPQLDRIRQILRDIQQEDHRASAVIREVRALARKQAPETRPLDLNTVVRDVLALVEADARRRGVEVEMDLDPRLPAATGDRTQLRQVVLNLALNGVDAVAADGSRDRRIRIRTRAADGQIELAVSDTGPGLAEEIIPRLFESFFSTKAEGLGLGLSIVRSIVEAHGGRVTAANNNERGATFRVQLPAERSEPPAQRET